MSEKINDYKTSNYYYSRTCFSKNHCSRWTFKELEYLLTERKKGKSFYAIALDLNRSEAGCYMKYHRILKGE